MKSSHRLLAACGAVATGLLMIGTAIAAPNNQAQSTVSAAQAQSNAVNAANALISGNAPALHVSSDDKFVQLGVTSSEGMQYVSYARTHKGLPVVGGDFVVVTDSAGHVVFTSVAQEQAIGQVATTAKQTKGQAEAAARKHLKTVTGVEDGAKLVVVAGSPARLAWETLVAGTDEHGEESLQSIYTDAETGAVLRTQEQIAHGDGTAAYNGPNPLHLDTSSSAGTFTMKDPTIPGMSCSDYTSRATFSGPDDLWGNGDATNKETGCVDALYSAKTQYNMLSQWLGRNGIDGNGNWTPMYVGWNVVNAHYVNTTNITEYGYTQATPRRWLTAMDVVGHENGHSIDYKTPGGRSGGQTSEFIGDVFGVSTEAFANQAAAYDAPDYLVGEEIDLVGTGPIRNMYNPSLVDNNPNCYSSAIPTTEVHDAAGPGNHWLYLLAEGTNPTGKPTSPTCDGSANLVGIGLRSATKILYNAMLMKNSSSNYLTYRTWTLQAAKNLYPNSCTEFNKVKAAWNAVSVPAQAADPTCSTTPTSTTTTQPTTTQPTTTTTRPTTTTTTPPPGCSGQKLVNPGFESGATSWTATSGVIGQNGAQQPTHGGTWNAWLDGYGRAHTDTVSQSVAIPAGCKASLTFWLHVDSAETTTTTAYDKLTVTAGTSTVATYSNLNKAAGYVQKTINLSSFAGQTVTLKFTGTEDSSLKTSFVVDDTALTLS
ncbi:MAG TPA: M4 family metallopeptidase [Actinokineospora sp.]|nr:M4 family metallopeptidase [Actinokineospora sp.]